MNFSVLVPAAAMMLCLTALNGYGQQTSGTTANAVPLPPVNVIGRLEPGAELKGSAAMITQQQIQNQTYTDPNRVLQQVPGVYVRDEDGYGNFPNFSLRGTDSVRSAKTTIMEDGILMSPAPYTFPAAYHNPRIGRMSGVEVFKGSTQLRYGPHTTGGVLNFLSTPFVDLPSPLVMPAAADGKSAKSVVPAVEGPLSADQGYWKSTYGSDNTWFNHAWWGETQRLKDGGTFGVLLEFFHNQSDGFRHIDDAGGTNTGFTLIEPMLRLFWEPGTELKQRLEFRFGYSDFNTNETHLGLTDADLRADPLRRYAASQYDNFSSQQRRFSLRHIVQPNDAVRIETTAYYTVFNRNWYKLNDILDSTGKPIPLPVALATPGEPLDILRGDAAGTWRIHGGDRDYDMLGLQSQVDWNFKTGSVAHDLTFGVRLHYDDGVRFERDDLATVNGQGKVTSFKIGREGAGGNRVEDVLAFSTFVEDAIHLGRLTVKPGMRWEHMDMHYEDRFTTGPDLTRVKESARDDLDAYAPGVALNFDLTETTAAFASYYRGISNPAPREFLRGDAQLETTDGYELGLRHTGKAVQAEIAGFYTNIDNMIVNDGLGGLGTIEDSNGGDGRLYGVEAAIRWDPLKAEGSAWGLPLRASLTYTHSAFRSGNPLANASTIYSGAQPGNKLPYVPEWAASTGIGIEHGGFGVYLDGTYISPMYGSANNATDLRDFNGNPDARAGKTDEAFIVDLSVRYQLTAALKLVAGISNLTGETYLTSRLPSGARANAPRSYFGGFEVRF